MSQKQSGFTLVELSIVLVILGLLVGGVLTGQSLIRASEMRASIGEYQRFTTAVYAFRDKYFAVPGDMANATSFWGIAGGTGSDDTCRNTVSTTPATCNGDGDGLIKGNSTGYANSNEYFRFWQHLANAGMIEGQYTGTDGRNSNASFSANVGRLNMPASKTGNSIYWWAYWDVAAAGTTVNFASPGGNKFRITTTGSTGAYNPEEAWNVDTKMDDGFPGSGKMMTFKGDATTPVTSAYGVAPPGDAGATYNFALKDRIVNPWIWF